MSVDRETLRSYPVDSHNLLAGHRALATDVLSDIRFPAPPVASKIGQDSCKHVGQGRHGCLAHLGLVAVQEEQRRFAAPD